MKTQILAWVLLGVFCSGASGYNYPRSYSSPLSRFFGNNGGGEHYNIGPIEAEPGETYRFHFGPYSSGSQSSGGSGPSNYPMQMYGGYPNYNGGGYMNGGYGSAGAQGAPGEPGAPGAPGAPGGGGFGHPYMPGYYHPYFNPGYYNPYYYNYNYNYGPYGGGPGGTPPTPPTGSTPASTPTGSTTSGSTPASSSGSTPGSTSGSTPGSTSGSTPGSSSGGTSGSTPTMGTPPTPPTPFMYYMNGPGGFFYRGVFPFPPGANGEHIHINIPPGGGPPMVMEGPQTMGTTASAPSTTGSTPASTT